MSFPNDWLAMLFRVSNTCKIQTVNLHRVEKDLRPEYQ